MDEYRLSPKAKDDMEAVWLYSSSKWGLNQTERYIDSLADSFDFLTKNSKLGISCDFIRKGYRRYPVKRHMVYFRETSYGIEIMRVLHDRMLDSLHLKS
jgi:toxin ParE1/3/4